MAIKKIDAAASDAVVAEYPQDSTQLIGSIRGQTGQFAVSDVEEVDARWTCSAATQSGWVVDFTGGKAEWLAARQAQGNYRREQLPNGTWRVHVPDQGVAGILRDEAMQTITSNIQSPEWANNKISVRSTGASSTKAIDAIAVGLAKFGLEAGIVGSQSSGPVAAFKAPLTAGAGSTSLLDMFADYRQFKADGPKTLLQIRLVPR